MDSLYQLALSSQTICGGIQFLLFSISLGAVIGALQHYHANDRLTFNCSPKPSDFTKQLCYDKYTSTVSPWLIPRNIAAIAYAVVFACWICFMLYGAVTLRQIRRQQPEQNRRHRQLRKFLRVYFVHVCFRIVFLGVMIGLFCSYQTLDLPSVFKCGPSVPKTNTTSIPVNQTETALQCNDLHYKEKSNLNIAIIVIEASVLTLAILEAIHLSLTRETFMEKLLGDVFDVGNNIEMESVLSSNEATENNPSARHYAKNEIDLRLFRLSLAMRLKEMILLTAFLFVLPLCVSGTIYYVDGEKGNDSNNGESIATAFATIATCINALKSPGDEWPHSQRTLS
ncbi:hypothetical protein OS493_031458 [Desmophyllum pertusum]|uniref:Uncharacterized protein n=1 Tax=Desmophyllum pertusum TaxID=174260 RepID=A0A9X0D7K5_9CNID|nr:hypothetical protein OS493_031458 [Desmophyllum pertusum]